MTFPWLRKFLPAGAGRFTAGSGPGVISLQGPTTMSWRLGPVICYEDILQGFLRGVGQLHPNLLVNLTSDSWFGADTEPWEHLALAVFASVELRVSMVRAVNSGVSALIDPNGRVTAKNLRRRSLPPSRAARTASWSRRQRWPEDTRCSVAVGNLFAYLCLAATLALLGGALVRARRLLKG